MATYVNKAYWTQARNELRRQVGTMRFDINNLVENKGSGKEDAKAFYKNVEKLDFAIRQKDKAAATAAPRSAAPPTSAPKAATGSPPRP